MSIVMLGLLLVLPLVGFLFNRLFSSVPRVVTSGVSVLAILLPFLISLVFLVYSNGLPVTLYLGTLFHSGSISADLGLYLDPLSLWMCLIITGVGTLIHLYSVGYMAEDSRYVSFFSYMNLFVFFMLILVLSDSYLGMFIGWEGVGLCSYLLIGFWYEKVAYHQAALKAFVLNRIGDLGFLFALFILFFVVGVTQFTGVFPQLPHFSHMALLCVGFGFLLAACGKSAQFPLMTWLPDAMAGPTPVSALIHAATMVTAGLYLMARSYPILSVIPTLLPWIVGVGLFTSLIGAFIAITQRDIKKILAYSTVSQLGMMMASIGLGAFHAALFHMTTHAFFKALLFLGAGSVIHAMNGEQDIFKMGGLRKHLPFTSLAFGIGTLAIIGCPPLSGFFSKDAILLAGFQTSLFVSIALVLISILTAWYMLRLYWVVFAGQLRSEVHPHEPGLSMKLPLAVLAIFSFGAGLLNTPVWPWLTDFITPSVVDFGHFSHHGAGPLLVATIIVLAGLIWGSHKRFTAPNLAFLEPRGVLRWSFNLLYLDTVFSTILVRPILAFSTHVLGWIELNLIRFSTLFFDSVQFIFLPIRRLHTGRVGSYILMIMMGLILMLGILLR